MVTPVAFCEDKDPLYYYIDEIMAYIDMHDVGNAGDIQIALDIPPKIFDECWRFLIITRAIRVNKEGVMH